MNAVTTPFPIETSSGHRSPSRFRANPRPRDLLRAATAALILVLGAAALTDISVNVAVRDAVFAQLLGS